jgi:hypothetical protein
VVQLLGHEEGGPQHRPLLAHFLQRHHRHGCAADHGSYVHLGRRLLGVNADRLQTFYPDEVGQRLRDADRPGAHVGYLHSEFGLLRVGLDPHRLLAPLAGFRALALLHRKPDERDAEGVHGLVAALGALLERLVQHVVAGAAQATADDLLGQQRRTEGA